MTTDKVLVLMREIVEDRKQWQLDNSNNDFIILCINRHSNANKYCRLKAENKIYNSNGFCFLLSTKLADKCFYLYN